MKTQPVIYVLIASLCALYHLNAQQNGSKTNSVPLPVGPLLKRAPDYCEWIIQYEGTTASTPKESDGGKGDTRKNTNPPVKTVVVTKAQDVVREAITDFSGSAVEIWHKKGFSLSRIKNDAQWTAASATGGNFDSPDYLNSDFSGLDWISPSTYVGVQSYQGRDCLVFSGKVLDKNSVDLDLIKMGIDKERGKELMSGKAVTKEFHEDDYKVPATALIDLETRLPVVFKYGDHVRSYQYRNIPHTQLAFPVEAEKSTSDLMQYKAKLSRGPAAP